MFVCLQSVFSFKTTISFSKCIINKILHRSTGFQCRNDLLINGFPGTPQLDLAKYKCGWQQGEAKPGLINDECTVNAVPCKTASKARCLLSISCSSSDSANSLTDKQMKYDQKSEDMQDTVDAHTACSCENEECSTWSGTLQHWRRQKHFHFYCVV